MKTLFITVSESWVTNTLLRSPFWFYLRENRDFRIVLLVPESKLKEYLLEFGAGDIIIESMPMIPLSFFERVTFFLARNVLKTGMIKFVHAREYYETKKMSLFIVKRILWFLWGRSRMLQKFVRYIELFFKPHPVVGSLFDRYGPSLVFSTIANYVHMDVPILREAKRRGVKTVGMFRGWDTFVSHGFLRIVSDLVLLQNKYLQDTGRVYQFLPAGIIRVVGFPQYDCHFRKDLIEPREDFFKKLGLDPGKRLILFGAMEYYWYDGDGEIAEVFNEIVESGKLPRDLIMLFRPYPGYVGPLERVKNLKYVLPDMEAFSLRQAGFLEFRDRHIAHLLNSIYHSEIVVSVASTIAIDGVALGKPAVSVAFEKDERSYWFSIKRFQEECTHFRDAIKTGGIRRVDTPEEFVGVVNSYLADPSYDADKRKTLKELFLEPYDGRAGERLAKIIRELL